MATSPGSRLRTLAARWMLAGAGLVSVVAAVAEEKRPPAPAAGMLLVAGPELPDPRFHHSVVILIEHGRQGTVGLIVNKPTRAPLSEVLPPLGKVEPGERRLFFGGPVELDSLTFLVRSPSAPKRATRVVGDVYWSGDAETLRKMLEDGKGEAELRVYAGYSGWAPGQLDAEIARGDWSLSPADAGALFPKDPEKAWEERVGRPPPDGIPIRWMPDGREVPCESCVLFSRGASFRVIR